MSRSRTFTVIVAVPVLIAAALLARPWAAAVASALDHTFHTPQTSDYPGVDRSFHTPQTSNYPGVKVDRSFHTPQTSDYPGVTIDRSFHTPQTSDYPGINSRVQPTPTPDF